MSYDFFNKVAVITGGSTGIGFSIAKKLLTAGAKRVYITGRSIDRLEKAVDHLGEKAIAVVSDVASISDLQRLKKEIENYGDRLDIIFANAGIAETNHFEQTTEAQFYKIFDINVKGVFFSIQVLLPLLNDGGAIVLTSSFVAHKGLDHLSLYSASKAAIRSFTRTLANDLKLRKIRVNALSPGFTQTPIMKNGMKLDDAQIHALIEYAETTVPLGFVAQPEDIASTALFLASDEARYVNGAELIVDGGLTQI
ncbi:SDR family oxidoreductase [Acinetobacter qingfengensis]|uniref:Oxidoreductase n=1 Tax=Acinetobacter qingfengensis TaxID=1262585 RepID=A0A1E7QXG8_9GAMM|nr:SDR family oxidoreductase [Acinetobacter qingfengensis]KAA8731662.1 SDR family oxidoreductase [Acinetobacter qingfengensis]OEY91764.1 oxidoreductase [Acinetobacter qingfengensis]